MNRNNMKNIAMNAMIAGVYAALTLCLAPISYGAIQMRLSEIMIFLAFYNKKFIPGLVVGCFLANMASPMGMWDMIFGTTATLIATLWINRSHNLFLSALIGAIVNGIIVGIELYLSLQLPLIMNMFYVFIGELIVLLIGVVVFKWMEKNKTFMNNFVVNHQE